MGSGDLEIARGIAKQEAPDERVLLDEAVEGVDAGP